MNILTFNYEYPPLGGGGGVVHALIAEELAKRHRVWVVTSAFGGLPRREERAGVQIVRVPVLGRRDQAAASLVSLLTYPPGAWLEAARLLHRERIDVVHSHFAVPTGVGSLPPAKLAGIPHVLSLHGGDIYDPSKALSPHRLPPVRAVVRWVLRRSAAVIAQSTNTRDNARRFYSFQGPIEVIPLGIRQPRVTPVGRAALGLPSRAFVAITVGRLVRRKGLDTLLRSLAAAASAGVHLVVVGEGPERAGLERIAGELGLNAHVHFVGRVDDERKWQLLQAADAYVSATLHEGFGLVYLEAMTAGIPVITFDHGGQVDFLRDGETGYLVAAGDAAGLTAALRRLAAEPARARAMGEQNRHRAADHRIEACAARYEALFAGLVEERAERPDSLVRPSAGADLSAGGRPLGVPNRRVRSRISAGPRARRRSSESATSTSSSVARSAPAATAEHGVVTLTEVASRAFFNRWARNYEDRRLSSWFQYTQHLAIERLEPDLDSVVLDVGCGTGYAVRALARLVSHGRVCGIDISPAMISEARSRISPELRDRVQFDEASAASMPYPDGTFSHVLCTNSFHHYPDPVAALREMKRVLKSAGELVILENAPDLSLYTWTWDRLLRVIEKGHVRYYPSRELGQMIVRAGFEAVRLRVLRNEFLKHGKLFASIQLWSAKAPGPGR